MNLADFAQAWKYQSCYSLHKKEKVLETQSFVTDLRILGTKSCRTFYDHGTLEKIASASTTNTTTNTRTHQISDFPRQPTSSMLFEL